MVGEAARVNPIHPSICLFPNLGVGLQALDPNLSNPCTVTCVIGSKTPTHRQPDPLLASVTTYM